MLLFLYRWQIAAAREEEKKRVQAFLVQDFVPQVWVCAPRRCDCLWIVFVVVFLFLFPN